MDELDQGNWLVGYRGEDRRRRETSEFVDPFDEYEMDWQRGVDTQIRLVVIIINSQTPDLIIDL